MRRDLRFVEQMSHGDEERIRGVLFASLRFHGADVGNTRVVRNIVLGGSILLMAIPSLVAGIHDAATGTDGPPVAGVGASDRVANLIAGLVIGCIANAVISRRLLPAIAFSWEHRMIGALSLPALSLAAQQIPYSLVIAHGKWWYICNGYFGLSAFLVIVLIIDFALEAPLRWLSESGRTRPYDRLVVLTVSAAAHVHELTRGRLVPQHSRRLCRMLEQLARAAEYDLTLPRRAPLRIRRTLRGEALRVAAVYRAHHRPLVLARNAHDADAVVASLLTAVDALIREDRAALLANAPDEVTPRNLARRIAARTLPGSALILSGVFLPFVPAVAQQEAVASSLRWTLVVAGVLTLVAGSDVASRVTGPLDKALPWK